MVDDPGQRASALLGTQPTPGFCAEDALPDTLEGTAPDPWGWGGCRPGLMCGRVIRAASSQMGTASTIASTGT
jgi:hypothetical protein